jgi:hypothetical protein
MRPLHGPQLRFYPSLIFVEPREEPFVGPAAKPTSLYHFQWLGTTNDSSFYELTDLSTSWSRSSWTRALSWRMMAHWKRGSVQRLISDMQLEVLGTRLITCVGQVEPLLTVEKSQVLPAHAQLAEYELIRSQLTTIGEDVQLRAPWMRRFSFDGVHHLATFILAIVGLALTNVAAVYLQGVRPSASTLPYLLCLIAILPIGAIRTAVAWDRTRRSRLGWWIASLLTLVFTASQSLLSTNPGRAASALEFGVSDATQLDRIVGTPDRLTAIPLVVLGSISILIVLMLSEMVWVSRFSREAERAWALSIVGATLLLYSMSAVWLVPTTTAAAAAAETRRVKQYFRALPAVCPHPNRGTHERLPADQHDPPFTESRLVVGHLEVVAVRCTDSLTVEAPTWVVLAKGGDALVLFPTATS